MNLKTFSAALLLVASASLFAADFAWIEGENPTRKPEIGGIEVSGWGHQEYMSGGKVLKFNVGEGDIEKTIPKDGAVFEYDFDLKSDGKHQVWARIGFEWIRSDFDWKVDGGEWQTLKNSDATTDLMEIAFWCEIAWIKLGEQDLKAGKHTLAIRHMPQSHEDKGKKVYSRILNFFDCFCISNGEFTPNNRFKPGEEYRSEKDKQAAAQVFEVKLGDKPEERSVADLSGLWQIARWDEQMVKPEERLQGPAALPDLETLTWTSIATPAERDHARPDLCLSHRNIYRTKVKMPAEVKDRSVYLHLQNFSMIAAVFLNGKPCGWSKNFYAEWDCDVTAAVKPGEVNDLVVVIKDRYYGLGRFDVKDPLNAKYGTRRFWNFPPDVMHSQGATLQLDMPMFGNSATGMFEPVSLVVAGKAYTSDVFAKTSVKKKEMGLEITVKNPTAAELKVKIDNEIVPWNGGKGGEAEKKFASQEVAVPAGQEKLIDIAEKWENPKLWWPDDPQLYTAVTRVSIDGKVVDTKTTRFGFREWEWDTHFFKLNGIKRQMWAHIDYGKSAEACVADAKDFGLNMFRLWHEPFNQPRKKTLDYFDEAGMPVRSSGVFDGEGCNYTLANNKALFDNWIEQLKAWVKTERNHPCVFIWSVENEITYINSCNFGLAKVAEPEARRGAEAVEKLDPTRPTMVDGGRCLLDKSMPVNGGHYNEMLSDATTSVTWHDFPDAAYTARDYWYKHIERNHWEMVPNRPILHGECFFAVGYQPAEYSVIDGDRCFIGEGETRHGKGLFGKMLSEGWRWNETAAWHFWTGKEDGSWKNSWQPVALLCRQWNWTFGSGSEIKRTLKCFNNTRFSDPIEAAWQLKVDGKEVSGKKETLDLPAGENSKEFEITFTLPAVKDRTKGEFILTCSRGGKEIFRDVKPIWVINPDAAAKPAIQKADLLVFDPAGGVKARLQKRGIEFTDVAALDKLPENPKFLIIGKDAVPADKATDPMWYSLAANGTKLLVIDQATPLHFQALPADLDVSGNNGRIAFSEDLAHPVFEGLDQADFFTWSGDHVVYRNAYRKGSKGFRSLAQCDAQLNFTALAECPVTEGLLLLSQFNIGDKLATDPVAQRLFDNMLNYAVAYKAIRTSTTVVCDPASPKGKLLASLNLQFDVSKDVLSAIDGKHGIAVIDATPENLKALAGAVDKVKAFTDGGGWMMIWGVTPDSLADYNKVVGFDHMIRKFDLERVIFSAPRDPLSSGMTLRDVVMDSGEQIANWQALRWPVEDQFSYILDYDEVGPFFKLPTPAELGKPAGTGPKFDHWPQNMFNGFTADDTWRLCYSIILGRDKTKWSMELPHEETFNSFSIILNVIYHKVTKINLYFDDDPTPITLETRPTHDRQNFTIPDKKAKKVTIELADWEQSGTGNVIGIDNMWFGVKRPEAFIKNVKPLLNLGGLMRYHMGKGGVVLNQLNIQAREKNPINAEKKGTITKTLLKNLGAVFQEARTVVASARLKYTPVKFGEGKFNAFISRKGTPPWFQHAGDISQLPPGENTFAHVRYNLLDFKTSAVPSCVMLQGHQSGTKDAAVLGIPVNQKCDALFFMHTFNATNEAFQWEKKNPTGIGAPVAFKYVAHYKDGTTADIPVFWTQSVGHWVQKDPKPLIAAAVAWSADFPGDKSGNGAVLYSMQWNNPHPDAEITSVDVMYGEDGAKWGAPALLAITAAEIAK